MSATNDDLLHAVGDSRDATMREIGGVKSAVATMVHELQGLSQRVIKLEERETKARSLPPPAMRPPPELDDLVTEFKRDRAERAARSSIRLEQEAEEAAAHLRNERRRKVAAWVLGSLFGLAQLVQIVRAMSR